ncbi:PAS domain-containing sensor histidine kinase [Hymenobacter sp. BT175]|uniref:PAS domain-containing sensor histidine kinase n=1 Tax=Hymenobacter translucens TaxID=2886507 RepID=UPI001D0F3E88|nr:PAS domain-containing sensor histidine kinase [Hymenobacter translucens]MCC2546619.1 PAS domain-containing sensor histidine kinase [Hymenobacter translucens]
MHSAPEPNANADSLAAENAALLEEVRLLRQQQGDIAKHQDAYAQSQARFRTVFENSPLGQKIIDPDLCIRQVNQAVVDMLGYTSPEDLLGRKILEFTHPDHRADWRELQQRLWAHKLPHFALETCLIRKDGSSFWCQITSVLFPDEGAELGYTILEDISERKKLETSLKRVYDAQETILQLATHDLKSPIAHIQLLTDLLQREVASRSGQGPPPPEMVHYLTLIHTACAHATTLLEDVLYIGDLDEHGLQKTPTDLPAFVTTRLAVHQLAARAAGVTLALDLPAEGLHARLHPEKFSRVLDNLLGNALKFTPAGGTVTLRVAAHNGKVRFTVQDTGIGIPGKLHNHLFDKFNPTRRAGLQGETTTGLGLFIAKQIVELHGGDIWLESREQAGSSFFIELP